MNILCSGVYNKNKAATDHHTFPRIKESQIRVHPCESVADKLAIPLVRVSALPGPILAASTND
jgi:hypothetical protein